MVVKSEIMGASWKTYSSEEVTAWLLENDAQNAPIRYLALRDLFGISENHQDLHNAKAHMFETGPIPAILAKQHPDGHWDRADSIYYDKYTGTCWSLIMLAQMGADVSDARVERGCEYLLTQGVGEHGGFSMNGRRTGTAHCIQGNLAAALLDLGYANEPRVIAAIDWMARSVTGEGFSESKDSGTDYYMRSGICGPGFCCSSNNFAPCAWGAVKVALAFSKIPAARRTKQVNQAVNACVDFLTSVDPASAEYPHPWAPKPSTSWFKFGFPVFYITDLLQVLEALTALGLKGDQRLQNAVDLTLGKRDETLRWPLEYTYNSKTWIAIEEKGKPSKWVTLRALRMLKEFSN